MLHEEASRLAFLQTVALGALDPDQQQNMVARKRGLDMFPSLWPHPDVLNQPNSVFEHLTFNLPGGLDAIESSRLTVSRRRRIICKELRSIDSYACLASWVPGL